MRTTTFRLSRWARLCAATLALGAAGCGSGASSGFALDVGTDDAGGTLSLGGDASPAAVAAFDAHIEQNHIEVHVVTVSCAGPCAEVAAVATGGNPPYSYVWDDGSTSAARDVCPTATTSYHVTATDTGMKGETATAPDSMEVSLTADVLTCPDGGSAVDAGSGTPGAPLTVPGIADVWLAGQPDGTVATASVGAAPDGMDVAPTNSPVEVPVVAGTTLTFAATGSVSNTGLGICYAATADGGGCVANIALDGDGPFDGLSSLQVPGNALIGVFLDASVPSGTAPAGLDATGAGGSFSTLSPLLRQVFFIGDGLTGTGSGSVQDFVVPAGATRLFLGSSDGFGGNYNNAGQFTVVVTTL